ncbi:hypothetical protein TPA0909_18970 [Streptomyces albus]|nr:hypothetical protein TPA0909_18970 [Streptomyces albus]
MRNRPHKWATADTWEKVFAALLAQAQRVPEVKVPPHACRSGREDPKRQRGTPGRRNDGRWMRAPPS